MPDLVGHVRAGDSFPKASIFIFTAGPKVGTSTYCPSCYADCRKSAKSGAQGEFKIESLDPQLLFRILVVAKGYKPKFVAKVDPATGPVNVELETVESREIKDSIRGRVVDSEGKPVIGAVVEARGIRKKNDMGSMWGQLPGVDPLAVTDEQGDFVISSREPFESLDVRVDARMLAPRSFTKLAGGSVQHTLTMTDGATVNGRVVCKDKPLAHVSVGMVGCDRTMEHFTGNFDVGTDADGRFSMVNLPPDTDYFIYGLMNTLKSNGAISIRRIHAGTDGAVLDLGDLTVEPAQRLAGKVVCTDGQPIPPNTRLLIGREDAWDTMQLELDKDGHFDTPGIPRESISLSARIPDYRVSARNVSLDTLNPYHLVGRMDHDVTNLVYLLEKGSDLRSEFDSQQPESEWARNRPLQGAEGVPSHAGQYLVSGRVLDSETKQPIPKSQVTPGNVQGILGRTSWTKKDSVEGTNGIYAIYVDKRYSQPVLKAEAEGYLPAKFTLLPESRANFDLTLRKGSGPSGTLLLPNGEPAQGVSVALLIPGEQRLHLKGDGTLQANQNRDLIQLTDPDGSFTLTPELEMDSVIAASKEGFKLIPVRELAGNPKVKLDPWCQIKGTLYRGGSLSTNEEIDLTLADAPSLSINLQYHTRTDAQGAFDFGHVPAVAIQINGRNMINENSWSWDPLKKVTLRPGQDLEVEIQAPARDAAKTLTQFPRGNGPKKVVPKPGLGLNGTVLLPTGGRAVGAEVALLVKGQYLAVGKGALRAYEARQQGLVVRVGSDGHFSLPLVEDATGVVVVHNQGYAHVALDKIQSAPEIRLEAWGTIEGVLHIGTRLGTNEQVSLEGDTMASSITPVFAYEDFIARTDEQGRFVMTFVPPGEQKLIRMIPMGGGSFGHSAPTFVTVKPGAVTQVAVGGTGIEVIGRIQVAGKETTWTNAHGSFHNEMPAAMKKARSPEEQGAWFSSPEAKAAMKNYRTYPVVIAPDGTFHGEEILPGKYELEIYARGNFLKTPPELPEHFRCSVIIPDTSGGTATAPADLGTLECEPIREAANR